MEERNKTMEEGAKSATKQWNWSNKTMEERNKTMEEGFEHVDAKKKNSARSWKLLRSIENKKKEV